MKEMLSILFLLSTLSGEIAAQDIKSGDLITPAKIESRSFHIGSIQQSFLNEADFISLAGNCWKILNHPLGNPIDISDSDLATLIGKNSLPNIRGAFIANSGGNSSAVGTIQTEMVKTHRHWVSNAPYDDGNKGGLMTLNQRYGLWADAVANGYSVNDHKSPYGRYSGWHNQSGETRPKNIGVNTFIKINYNCN